MGKGILYAATAGFIGAALWVGLAYFFDREINLLAWGIGAGVGMGMWLGVRPQAEIMHGAVAVAITMAALLGGKYVAIELIVQQYFGDTGWAEEAERVRTDETYAMTYLADQVLREYQRDGKELEYPLGANTEYPEDEDDYPLDVWNETSQRWQAMTPDERQAFLDDQIAINRAYFETQTDQIIEQGFLESFVVMDLLWYGLAGFFAFQLGSGAVHRAGLSEPGIE